MRKRSARPALKAKKSRTRSGCFTCRDRHMKCDEQLPVCQNCINSKRKCYRGIRLNFSQYVIYNPKSSGFWNEMLVPGYYRILDQSIAIAKLYKNGYSGYKQYRNLHMAKDLAEAEQVLRSDLQSSTSHPPNLDLLTNGPGNADLILQQEDLSQFFDTWLFSGETTDLNSSQMIRNRIQENVDIKRILMNPELHDKQLGGVMQADFNQKMSEGPEKSSRRKPLFAAATAPELQMLPEDADGFINLIHRQKYFWLLDLFNELRIWESCVPSYCVRLYQASKITSVRQDPDDKFLFSCLLLSDERTSTKNMIKMTQLQVQRWREFEKKDVTFSTFPAFEKVIISTVLIVQSVLVKAMQPDFIADPQIIMILANQGKLIHRATARYNRVPVSILKRLGSTTFTVASFQAIVVLRFFLKMTFRKLGIQTGRHLSAEELASFDSNFSFVIEDSHEISEFFTLNESEVSLLCNDYHGLDLVQGKSMSDSKKLRAQFWELVLCDYQTLAEQRMSNPSDLETDVQSEVLLSEDTTALIPNPRCLALRILKLHHQSISGASDVRESSFTLLLELFKKIQESAMSRDTKIKWILNFDWSIAR
ncbi:hypothetical protein METBIDRAFT_40365 [Metschnikowia bicuspidata var. bicuspidata NRRL YB-4993]|uniref:Zn(2)-C6 fungal-type domain-containing protein n=1 Tax=Metschnikowia bicuspidata var. bicuspidata NRRL YB-4993 TaxID=869754 RepID=A0A1A0HD11_9ASCO|nr:hypothetical protein METBIDRAFT_40365 [Metschnikowia bicuspidata var. bicuspidata NRRL YB-4993]OBA21865.1 hypothetical protein METBIDRAFT_40365 [Metschnikowia bicuspidata var. bicuspidata NRRL YB-4993]